MEKPVGEEDKLDEAGIEENIPIMPVGYKTPEYKREDQEKLTKAPSKHADNASMAVENLLSKLPELDKHFEIHHKIGEGTFSNVYLASMKGIKSRTQFAIKHLIPTSHPKRIQYELECLTKIGGSDNVVSCDICLRNNDCVVFIMPYLEHQKFGDYVKDMTVAETKLYMKNLFLALKRVHSFNIIHRDVKPSNFLYNRDKKQFLLVDFGLAQQASTDSTRLNKMPSPNLQKPTVAKRKREEDDLENVERPAAKRKALSTVSNQVEKICPTLKYGKEPLSVLQRKCQEAKTIPIQTLTNAPKRQPLSSNPSNLMASKNLGAGLKAAVNSIKSSNLFKSPNKVCTMTGLSNFARLNKVSTVTGLSNIAKPKQPNPTCFLKPLTGLSNFATPSEVSTLTGLSNTAKSKPSDGKVKPSDQPKVPARMQTFQRIVPQKTSSVNAGTSFIRVQNSKVQQNVAGEFCRPEAPAQASKKQCACDGRPQICNLCLVRRPMNAARAGTPGFRPPEVLLKSQHQTTAVDMWAAGVIMICILSGCYPFFRSPDDLTALMEFITSFGSTPIKNLARKLGRNVICNEERKPLNLRNLCERLRRRSANGATSDESQPKCPDCRFCADLDLGCLCEHKSKIDLKDSYFPPSAYHLLSRLLEVDPATRITAEAALRHPFIAFM